MGVKPEGKSEIFWFSFRNDLACVSEDKEKQLDKDKIIDNRTLNILSEDSEVKCKDLYRTTKLKSGLDTPDRKLTL